MTPKQIREFVLAGNALFTLKSLKTGKHFTFKVKRTVRYDQKLGRDVPMTPPTWKVSVLNGRDNSKDYRYIGTIRSDHDFVRISGIGSSVSFSTAGFDWFWTKLRLGNSEKLSQAQFRHAGRCGRCGRVLTVPSSIDSGIGPECQDKMAFEAMGGVEGLMNQLFGG